MLSSEKNECDAVGLGRLLIRRLKSWYNVSGERLGAVPGEIPSIGHDPCSVSSSDNDEEWAAS